MNFKTLIFGILLSPLSLLAQDKNGFVPLFNGKDLDNWKLSLRNKDSVEAKKVFAVSDGMVHVYKDFADSLWMKKEKGNRHGLMYTKKEYSRFIFKFQYKWGTKIYNNFDQFQYDAGCYYHVFDDKIWPDGIEYQVRYNHLTQKNHTGDFWASNTLFQWSEDDKHQFLMPNKNGKLIEKRQGEHRGADVPFHALDGEWNTCEVIVMGNKYAIHKLNGKLVNYATDLSVEKGIIGLQCETAEIFYRNIEIKEFDKFIPAEKFLKKLK
ncbi:MAG: DUF1080 domain-containing protein [Pseudarcicella sp.]|nr:DUF1080 domain-containing protein [Pseudarcicella sp.]MBP6410874.1 DUF1080 domain-containing protein [Pseudarcicella sp.]